MHAGVHGGALHGLVFSKLVTNGRSVELLHIGLHHHVQISYNTCITIEPHPLRGTITSILERLTSEAK